MFGSTILIFFSLAYVRAGLESIPFGLYEELRNSTNEQCRIDVSNMLDGVKNLDKWALESWFSQYIYIYICFQSLTVLTKHVYFFNYFSDRFIGQNSFRNFERQHKSIWRFRRMYKRKRQQWHFGKILFGRDSVETFRF